jgi:hypothetical protein
VRSTVVGSEHLYLISRTERSATFDAHITRLRASPHKTVGLVAVESRTAVGQGAGRGFHEMDSTIVFEIDRILELNDNVALISFRGNEINARWVPREEMLKQGLNDMIADFIDSSKATLVFATTSGGPKFTMNQTAVARLENKRTHDAFARKEGWKGNALLMCAFCPTAFHFGCLGMDLRERAPKGDWRCPTRRTADDLTRLDEKPRKHVRLAGPHP